MTERMLLVKIINIIHCTVQMCTKSCVVACLLSKDEAVSSVKTTVKRNEMIM